MNFEDAKNNRDVVIQFIKKHGSEYLPVINEKFRDDKELVKMCVEEDVKLETPHKATGSALFWASDRLKNDKDFVLDICKINERCFRHAGEEVKADKDIILYLVKEKNLYVKGVADTLKDNEEFIREVVKHDHINFDGASDRLKSSFSFVNDLSKNISTAVFHYADESIKNICDPEDVAGSLELGTKLEERGIKISPNINIKKQYDTVTLSDKLMEELTAPPKKSKNKTKKL